MFSAWAPKSLTMHRSVFTNSMKTLFLHVGEPKLCLKTLPPKKLKTSKGRLIFFQGTDRGRCGISCTWDTGMYRNKRKKWTPCNTRNQRCLNPSFCGKFCRSTPNTRPITLLKPRTFSKSPNLDPFRITETHKLNFLKGNMLNEVECQNRETAGLQTLRFLMIW